LLVAQPLFEQAVTIEEAALFLAQPIRYRIP
jgi:hypothetical protein